jgi:CTP synthase
MRLGAYPADLLEGSLVRSLYGQARVSERHRHRYEVNNAYRDRLTRAGLVVSGASPDGQLVEFVELPPAAHPFFVATQAHPEFRSRPARAHPLFEGLVAAAVRRQQETRLPVEVGPTSDDQRDRLGAVETSVPA